MHWATEYFFRNTLNATTGTTSTAPRPPSYTTWTWTRTRTPSESPTRKRQPCHTNNHLTKHLRHSMVVTAITEPFFKHLNLTNVSKLSCLSCCVFWPAFGSCAHPKTGQTTFFQPFSSFFVNFKPFFSYFTAEINKNRLKMNKKSDICLLLKAC